MRYSILLAAMAMLLACDRRAEAGRFFCHHCGCCQNCKKVCHLKCEKKEETKTEYTCECEDFCIPGPSKKCGVKREHTCDGHHRTILWQPTCARVHTRKKLVKKEVTKEVPDYKWVVEEYCCVCGHWVKVERDKDKDKQDKEDDSEKSDRSGSGAAKKKAAGSDRPNSESQDGGLNRSRRSKAPQSDRPPGPSDDGDSQSDSTDADDSKIERLPAPPAERGDRQTRWNHPPANYRAYYLGAEPDAVLELPTAAEVELIEPQAEPRRLFFGVFSR